MENPEIRLKRLRMRSWRRGTKEMDLILGGFADAELSNLDADALDAHETMMAENDNDLYAWISGADPIPPQHHTAISKLIDFVKNQRI